MNETIIKFINRSNDTEIKDIVIYQKNETLMSHTEIPIAWKVIKNCGVNQSYSFAFDSSLEVSLGDFMGNYKTSVRIEEGKVFEIVQGNFGAELKRTERKTQDPFEFVVLNGLRNESFNVSCMRNQRIVAEVDNIYPNESAFFQVSDVICISLGPDVEEGKAISYALMNNMMAQFNLSQIGSADIVMTGGGEGEGAQPLRFSMENVERKKFNPHSHFNIP